MSEEITSAAEHKQKMQEQQRQVRAKIADAKTRRGIIIYLYGNGKGKSSSAFGTLARSLGHGKKGAVVQFIKGKWKTGEQAIFKRLDVKHLVMGTGFTWDTQDREKDIAAAEAVWEHRGAVVPVTPVMTLSSWMRSPICSSMATCPPKRSARCCWPGRKNRT